MAGIEMPVLMGFRSKRFQLGRSQQLTPVGSGFIQTIDRTTPFWFAEYETPPLAGDRYNETTAFMESLEGSGNTFLAYDPRRPMPYAYRTLQLAADPWTLAGQAAPRITAQDYANSTITLDRLANGAIITKGDYISVLVGNIWYLFKSQTTFTVVANTAVLTVKPRPAIVGALPVNIRYRKACMEMKMIGEFEEDDSVGDFPVIRFNASQFVNRT